MRKLFLLLVCLAATWAAGSGMEGEAKGKALSATARQLARAGYVNVKDADASIEVSLMYARADNFTGRVLYADLREAYLHPKTAAALANRQLLREVMTYGGFRPLRTEWWHFNLVSRAVAKKYYKVIK